MSGYNPPTWREELDGDLYDQDLDYHQGKKFVNIFEQPMSYKASVLNAGKSPSADSKARDMPKPSRQNQSVVLPVPATRNLKEDPRKSGKADHHISDAHAVFPPHNAKSTYLGVNDADATNKRHKPRTASMWTQFVMRRPRLLQAAVADSVRTGTFHDVEIHVYSKRESASEYTHAPSIIHARASFLEEASSALRDLLRGAELPKRFNGKTNAHDDDEYGEDSDWEEETLDTPTEMPSDMSDTESIVASDFDSHGFTAHSDRAPSIFSSPANSRIPGKIQRTVVHAPFGAAKTWQALIMYLYSGTVSFAPSKSSAFPVLSETSKGQQPSCSAKSMYRLANKLELTELGRLCEEAIIADLHVGNIVKELFSDFTWRYPDVLAREVSAFKEYRKDEQVRVMPSLRQAFRDMASGKLPGRDAVLSALFDDVAVPIL
ncbi:hypothetical protein BC629DRAFT_892344 [Irpex lacteus]|nr:hypothetical protein BC629DRAFT_892344 [Irpex lacteus]